jgi:hypothetical protein
MQAAEVALSAPIAIVLHILSTEGRHVKNAVTAGLATSILNRPSVITTT